MRGPLTDLVLLSLVLAFFALQQRQRKETYFRFWVAAWAFVVSSTILWEFNLRDVRAVLLQDVVRWILTACGSLSFLFSFFARQRGGRKTALRGMQIGIPLFIAWEVVTILVFNHAVLIVLVVVGELVAAVMCWIFLRSRGGWLLFLMTALCPLGAACLTVAILANMNDSLMQIAIGQVMIASGILFSFMQSRGGRAIGSIGFFLWGFAYVLINMPFMHTEWVYAIYSLWSIPKYLVSFGMILKLFIKVNEEYAELSGRHARQFEEYLILFNSNPHPMAIYDVQTKHFLAVNETAMASYGYTHSDFLGMTLEEIYVDESDNPGPVREVPVGIANRVARHQKANGDAFDVDITGNDVRFEGRDARLIMMVDITEREALNRELLHMAHHDALTGLPNRVMLEDRVLQWFTRCVREETIGAFLTIDIDHFKKVNDTYGHQVGDECLKITADRLRSRVRQVDTIARTGGEEFTIVIGGLKSREGIAKVCSELLKLFETPIRIPGYELPLTVSIGVALYPFDGEEIETLRRLSDQALYWAKRTGRNRAAFAEQVADKSIEQAS